MKILKLIKLGLPLLLFLSLVIFFWRGLYLDPRAIPSTLINKPTPKFSLPLLRNPDEKLTDTNFLGQVSLLNVWATWCVACAEEHPILIDIASTKEVPIYGLDYKDKRSDALQWLKTYGNPYQEVGFDVSGNVAINWGVYGAPETYVIDNKGIVRYKYIGPLTHAVWRNDILPLVKKLKRES